MKLKPFTVYRICLALLVWLGALGFAGSADSRMTGAQLAARGFALKASSGTLELYVNEATGFFAVRQTDRNLAWFSSPLDWESDVDASGFKKNALPSLLSIKTKDANGSLYPANSWVNVVKREGLLVEDIEGGVRLTNSFEREGITIPVDVTLDDGALLVSVSLGDIYEREDTTERLLDFTLAPYFGAAYKSENGYFLVPDGSGALIRFNNRNGAEPYKQYVYGRDPSIVPIMRKAVSQAALLPVFGMSRSDGGFVAMIEGSAARGWINAETAYQKTGYNAASASCIVRDYDVVTFRERTGTPRDISVFEQGNFKGETFAVRYVFLSGTQNSYAGMARAYRDYLKSAGRFPQEPVAEKPSLLLDLIGSGEKVKPVAGIPMRVGVAYTPFSKARTLIEELKSKGVDSFAVKYEGWAKGGLMGGYPDAASPESRLGGKREFRALARYLDESQIPFYPSADFVRLYEPGIAHLKETSANRAVNRSPAEIIQYRLTTFDKHPEGKSYWLLRAGLVEKEALPFASRLAALGVGGFAPDSLGNLPASDYSVKNGTSRAAAAASFANLLQKMSADARLLLGAPCDYALPYVSFASDLPATSSQFDVEDEAVPFYQMVLKGHIPFSNLSGNRDIDADAYRLQLVESGAMPAYLLATDNPQDMRDTRLECYQNVYAADWVDEIASVWTTIKPTLALVAGAEIVDHEILADGVRRTTFSNGVRVIVNYSRAAYAASGTQSVAPRSFAVLQGGSK